MFALGSCMTIREVALVLGHFVQLLSLCVNFDKIWFWAIFLKPHLVTLAATIAPVSGQNDSFLLFWPCDDLIIWEERLRPLIHLRLGSGAN
jgi:hypothetical protein